MSDHLTPKSSLSPSFPSLTCNLLPFSHTRRTLVFAYGFVFTFLISIVFILLNPSVYVYSPWFLKYPSFFFGSNFPNSGTSNGSKNSNISSAQGANFDAIAPHSETLKDSNISVSDAKKQVQNKGSMLNCNIFDGEWVSDGSYPLYQPGSCPLIEEPFNCFLNHRPDNDYEKYKWQPHGCHIPRLNGTNMLELMKGKRLVFVGDSLNKNMWESLVCILRNSLDDKKRVLEASEELEFRTEGFYSFIFADYNLSVEFFRSNFLVQEWEVADKKGSKKETLRLDLIERSADRYKDADVLIFNTGHWWTHEKTLRGQGYYQEGSHVYSELDVNEAFRKALTTWSRWVDSTVDPRKTQVFFRGYSVSHFSGGEWNSGGKCDDETKPYKNDTSLSRDQYPTHIEILEEVLKWMKMPVFYLNVTRMTDYRIDAHPAIYRGQDLTEEERRSPLRHQDCSHWCLPGVPDIWNELVFSQLLIRHYQES